MSRSRRKSKKNLTESQFKYDVFFSYSRAQSEFIKRLVKQWRNNGLEVAFDQDFNRGDILKKAIRDDIENSKSVVVFVTVESIVSKWVAKEVEFAISAPDDKKPRLIPVLLEPLGKLQNDFKKRFGRFIFSDLSQSSTRQKNYSKLMRQLYSMCGIKKKRTPRIPKFELRNTNGLNTVEKQSDYAHQYIYPQHARKNPKSPLSKAIGALQQQIANAQKVVPSTGFVSKLNQLYKSTLNPKFDISFVGQTGAGKSKVINTLLNRPELLPSYSLSTTSVVTTLHLGKPNKKEETCELKYFTKLEWNKIASETDNVVDVAIDVTDVGLTRKMKSLFGKSDKFPPNELAKRLATVNINGEQLPEPTAHITKSVDIFLPREPFDDYLAIVDTPGYNERDAKREEIAFRHIRKISTAVLVLAGRPQYADFVPVLDPDRLIIFANKIDGLTNPKNDIQARCRDIKRFVKQRFGKCSFEICLGSAFWAWAALEDKEDCIKEIFNSRSFRQGCLNRAFTKKKLEKWDSDPKKYHDEIRLAILVASGIPKLRQLLDKFIMREVGQEFVSNQQQRFEYLVERETDEKRQAKKQLKRTLEALSLKRNVVENEIEDLNSCLSLLRANYRQSKLDSTATETVNGLHRYRVELRNQLEELLAEHLNRAMRSIRRFVRNKKETDWTFATGKLVTDIKTLFTVRFCEVEGRTHGVLQQAHDEFVSKLTENSNLKKAGSFQFDYFSFSDLLDFRGVEIEMVRIRRKKFLVFKLSDMQNVASQIARLREQVDSAFKPKIKNLISKSFSRLKKRIQHHADLLGKDLEDEFERLRKQLESRQARLRTRLAKSNLKEQKIEISNSISALTIEIRNLNRITKSFSKLS